MGGNKDSTFSIVNQLGIQGGAALITIVWSGLVSIILLKLTDAIVGIRVSQNDEINGLDLSEHGERAYNE